MAEPRPGDIQRAFLEALNESGTRYLVVGDMAWNKHRDGIRESNRSEAWVEPSASAEATLAIYAQTYAIVRKAFPETNRDQLMVKVQQEVKIHREQPPLNFETSYAERVPWMRLGQPTNVLSGDHLVARELASPDELKRDQANELLRHIRAKEFGHSQNPERGPEDDPGPKPKFRRQEQEGQLEAGRERPEHGHTHKPPEPEAGPEQNVGRSFMLKSFQDRFRDSWDRVCEHRLEQTQGKSRETEQEKSTEHDRGQERKRGHSRD